MAYSAKVVIGANFGDEGKGLVTDFLAQQDLVKTLVIRFNGGAQAGHTVETPCGKRHVFSHIGSGALADASTYLSRFFICDPIRFVDEFQNLKQAAGCLTLYIDPRALIVTPYDIIINRLIEEQRAANKHGSCGLGIGETVERNQNPAYQLTIADFSNREKVVDKLVKIRCEWLPRRLQNLKATALSSYWETAIASDRLIEEYLDHVFNFLEVVTITSLQALLPNYENLIFEGAQGLLLDQEKGEFPYVTRSHTGLLNVIALINEIKLSLPVEIYYVSRAYLTRHGAGPLPHELTDFPYPGVHQETTNIHNVHQGIFRYSWFNMDLFLRAIQQDLQDVPANLDITPHIVITCLDQLGETISFVHNNRLQQTSVHDFLCLVAKETAAARIFCAYGPTRNDVREFIGL